MSTLRVNSLLNAAGTDTPAIDGLAKAWVNFNGTGTVAIRESFNVSSITDNGTGNYAVNFTNAMPDTSYSCVGGAGISGAFTAIKIGNAWSTTSITVDTSTFSAWTDAQFISVAVFR